MREIPLTNGGLALVDDADFEWLMQWKWRSHSQGYPSRGEGRNGATKTIYMHRVIAQPPEGMEVDHINGDKRDNRRTNLRICTRHENMRNVTGYPRTSRFKGVCFYKARRRWAAAIKTNGKRTFLGYFPTEEEAARAYDKVARERFGEFAHLNFPE